MGRKRVLAMISIASLAMAGPLMEEIAEPRYPVLKSVLVATAVMIAIGAGWGGVAHAFDYTPRPGSGTLTTLVSIIAGASWFRRKIKREMSHRERLGFATGIAFINVIDPIALWAAVRVLFGVPLSIAGLDTVLGGGKGYLDRTFVWVMVYAISMSFALAQLFGWLYTRAPRQNTTATKDAR
jgi:hypothetical protein